MGKSQESRTYFDAMIEDKLPPSEDELIKNEEVEDTQVEVEYTTREDYIRCACDSLNAADNYNALTQEENQIIKRIKWRCLLILDELVQEMHDELFGIEKEQ